MKTWRLLYYKRPLSLLVLQNKRLKKRKKKKLLILIFDHKSLEIIQTPRTANLGTYNAKPLPTQYSNSNILSMVKFLGQAYCFNVN